ncbi:hypothetical protein GCM10007301_15460 [Azorhizobium oxalatiphilum]|uniref:Uncharacterized protein n=1 Tax=Azorhizobium oxalatiphilum TaxID=980631 RepID=A0A917BUE1_9HYPH|nr:hypothetical protein [Azorhizobium oxalatiphilum]GGF56682.1 hypothetical protein GCM10007301_15460 [Azorhizobium oxalatiphilum]
MGWNDALAAADRAVASYFDTTDFTATGMTKPERAVNADGVVDSARPAFDFKGTLEKAPEFSAFDTTSRPSPADRNIRKVDRICLTADSTAWPWMPKQGDRIRSASALYALAAEPDNDGTRRVALWLNRISG